MPRLSLGLLLAVPLAGGSVTGSFVSAELMSKPGNASALIAEDIWKPGAAAARYCESVITYAARVSMMALLAGPLGVF